MGEKRETWVSNGSATPLQTVGPEGHVLTPGEVLIEIDACSLWHDRLGFAFGDVHADAGSGARPQSRIAGHVVEAGEDALYFVDRSVAVSGVAPCGQNARCWTGGTLSCPNKASADADGQGSQHLIAPAAEVAVLGERMSRPSVLGLDPFKDG